MTARKPTATELRIKESIDMIPEIREGEGYVSPTRALPDSEPEEDTEVELGDEVVKTDRGITPEEFERMKEVLAEMAVKDPEPPKMDMRPGKDKMMPLSGGLYLPVRRRVAWMRGEPIPRPTWGIVNTLLKYEMGTLEAPRGGGPGGKMAKISGGYAVVKSEIIDDDGRIIATGYAQERSEIFPDFIEKAECVPDDTEILTRNGWKLPSELTIGEDVAAYDTSSDKLAWTPLQRVVRYSDTPIVRLANRHAFEVWCTPDHSWAVRSSTVASGKKYTYRKLRETSSLTPGQHIIIAAKGPDGGSPVTADEAALMGWAITDGTIRLAQPRISLYQSKPAHIPRLRELADKFNGRETTHPASTRTFPTGRTYDTLESHTWSFGAKTVRSLMTSFGISTPEELPSAVVNLSSEARIAMMDAMMAADGDARRVFAAKKEYVRSTMAALAAMEGIGTAPLKERGSTFRLRLSRHVDASHLVASDAGVADVWCPTTKYGTWVARFSNGVTTITGNTAAVGRAAALAGFGTEAALDLDEGLDQENVVDAPVRPITITRGDVTDSIKVGGRVSGITNAQLKEISKLVKDFALTPASLATIITNVTGEVIPTDVLEDEDSANRYLINVLRKLSNADAGKMIGELLALGEG